MNMTLMWYYIVNWSLSGHQLLWTAP